MLGSPIASGAPISSSREFERSTKARRVRSLTMRVIRASMRPSFHRRLVARRRFARFARRASSSQSRRMSQKPQAPRGANAEAMPHSSGSSLPALCGIGEDAFAGAGTSRACVRARSVSDVTEIAAIGGTPAFQGSARLRGTNSGLVFVQAANWRPLVEAATAKGGASPVAGPRRSDLRMSMCQ